MLPLVVAGALACAQVLAGGLAAELAGHAAEAGAAAMLQGRDPRDAARRAVPGWSRKRLTVSVSGRRIRVRLEPPALVPGAGRLLAATSTAQAGPR